MGQVVLNGGCIAMDLKSGTARTPALCVYHDWSWSLSSSCDHYHHHLDHNGDLNKNTVDGVHDHHIAAFNDDHHHADYVDLKDRKKLTKAHLVVNLLLKLTFAFCTHHNVLLIYNFGVSCEIWNFWFNCNCNIGTGISDSAPTCFFYKRTADARIMVLEKNFCPNINSFVENISSGKFDQQYIWFVQDSGWQTRLEPVKFSVF